MKGKCQFLKVQYVRDKNELKSCQNHEFVRKKIKESMSGEKKGPTK